MSTPIPAPEQSHAEPEQEPAILDVHPPHEPVHGWRDFLRFDFAWNSFDQSAWHSARDTGALAYMPADEVQRYADSYDQQEIVNKEAVSIFTTQSELAAPFYMEPDNAALSKEEVASLLHDCAITYLHLATLKQLVAELQKNYEDTLHKP